MICSWRKLNNHAESAALNMQEDIKEGRNLCFGSCNKSMNRVECWWSLISFWWWINHETYMTLKLMMKLRDFFLLFFMMFFVFLFFFTYSYSFYDLAYDTFNIFIFIKVLTSSLFFKEEIKQQEEKRKEMFSFYSKHFSVCHFLMTYEKRQIWD